MTDLARHIDVGEEVHLDLDRAVAGAVLAPTTLDVERETALQVAPDLGLGCLGEQPAHVVEDPGVGGWVGPRRTSDRALVDVHHLVQVLDPLDAGVASRHGTGAVELPGEHVEQDVVDERRLAGAGDAGNSDKAAQRELHVDALQVVLTGALHDKLATRRAGTAYRG